MDIRIQFVVLSIYFIFHETEETTFDLTQKGIKICSKCPPGWGVVKKCTKDSDTQCEKCLHGKTYSTHHSHKSPCWLCSRCGIGLYEAHRCSATRDTICDECTSILDHKNFIKRNDFSEKCSYLFLKKFRINN